jgi:hypothetical protein
MRQPILLFRLLCWWSLAAVLPSLLAAKPSAFHSSTDWQLKPSVKYDALCLLNVLSGDPYYLQYYQTEYDHFHPLFTPVENAAFVQLKRIIKDEGGGIVSAKLALYFSVVDDQTLPEMIHTVNDSATMEAGLKKTPYWSDEGWKNYQEAKPSLETALEALNRVGFPGYWDQVVKPTVESRIAELSPEMPKYNIVPAIERLLGFPLQSQTITVYLLAYSEPHGIRITGLRFLTYISYPFKIVLHNAIHESMHPPYEAHDSAVRDAIDLLARDPLIADKVKHHDPSFGYNTASGYIEEDSVQALEQIVSEEFAVGRNAQQYWQQQDGGMHLLAAAIYVEYKRALSQGAQPYSKWFVHAVESGDLREGKLQTAVRDFFSANPSQRSK